MKEPQELIDFVHENIDGRLCDEHNNCYYLASAVHDAGDGDYLEIGSLFGGSAILAALVKKETGDSGKVFAYDPFDGYYIGVKNERGSLVGARVDPVTRKYVTIERARANAKKMKVEVEFIKGTSDDVKGGEYSLVYIDGDHWNDGPMKDFDNVKGYANKLIVFDNCDILHPAVERACREVWSDPDWKLLFYQGVTIIFQRVI